MSLPRSAYTPLTLQLLVNGIPLDLLPEIAWPSSAVGTDFTPTAPPC